MNAMVTDERPSRPPIAQVGKQIGAALLKVSNGRVRGSLHLRGQAHPVLILSNHGLFADSPKIFSTERSGRKERGSKGLTSGGQSRSVSDTAHETAQRHNHTHQSLDRQKHGCGRNRAERAHTGEYGFGVRIVRVGGVSRCYRFFSTLFGQRVPLVSGLWSS